MTIKELFDRCAESYEQDRPKLVPCFDEFYGTVIRLLPFSPSDRFRCLDLGAGTGLLSAMVKQAFPAAAVHLTDLSEPMLAKARQRFAGVDLVIFTIQNHLDLSASAEYDVVLSALSIHHLSHPEKQELFHRVHRALRPGGFFINADQVLGPTPGQEALYQEMWLRNAGDKGISADALEQAIERVKLDRNATLADQLDWLKAARFREVDCWFKSFRFAVFGGRK